MQGTPALKADFAKLASLHVPSSGCLVISDTQVLLNLKHSGFGLLSTAKPAAECSQSGSILPFCLDPAAWQMGQKDDLNKWLFERRRHKVETSRMTLTKHSFGNPKLSSFLVHRTAEGYEVRLIMRAYKSSRAGQKLPAEVIFWRKEMTIADFKPA